jgi:hypothetical protein
MRRKLGPQVLLTFTYIINGIACAIAVGRGSYGGATFNFLVELYVLLVLHYIMRDTPQRDSNLEFLIHEHVRLLKENKKLRNELEDSGLL